MGWPACKKDRAERQIDHFKVQQCARDLDGGTVTLEFDRSLFIVAINGRSVLIVYHGCSRGADKISIENSDVYYQIDSTSVENCSNFN